MYFQDFIVTTYFESLILLDYHLLEDIGQSCWQCIKIIYVIMKKPVNVISCYKKPKRCYYVNNNIVDLLKSWKSSKISEEYRYSIDQSGSDQSGMFLAVHIPFCTCNEQRLKVWFL